MHMATDNPLNDLLIGYLDGELSSDDQQRLANLVDANDAARDQFVELCYLVGLLAETSHDTLEAARPSSPMTRRSRVVGVYATLAAALIALTITTWFILNPNPHPPSPNPSATSSSSVGILTDRSDDAVFADSSSPMTPGVDLPAERIHLVAGKAQFMFKSTATVDLIGPCEFEMIGPDRGYLHRGSLHAFVPPRAVGFTIDTPHGSVVDLGTGYDLQVDADRSTQVHVTEGCVAVLDRTPSRRLLWRGDRAVLNSTGLAELTRGATLVEAHANSPYAYRIQRRGLVDDAIAHTDRAYQWNGLSAEGLPEKLRGADFVQTPMADKNNHDLQLRVTLSRPSMLYVIVSARVTPAWLSTMGFSDTGWRIGLDNTDDGRIAAGPGQGVDLVYVVWQLRVEEPRTLVLGPPQHGDEGKVGTYGVAAAPLDEAYQTMVGPEAATAD